METMENMKNTGFDVNMFNMRWKNAGGRSAFEYMQMTTGQDIPDEYLTEEEKIAKYGVTEDENNAELEDLRKKYTEKFNEEVPRNKKNNIEWIKEKLTA